MFEGKRVSKVIGKLGPFQDSVPDIRKVVVADNDIKPARISHWFIGCRDLETADLSKLDTTDVVYADGLFQNCRKLKSVQMPRCGLPSAVCLNDMFNGCESLKNLDMSGYDFHSAADLHYMFAGCKSLEHIGADTWDTTRFSDLHGVFYGCGNLEEDLSSWSPLYWSLNADFNAGAPGVIAPDWNRRSGT